MIHNILLTTKAHFTHKWVKNTGNSHLCDQYHPHGNSQKHFQHPFSEDMSNGVIHDQHIVFHTFPYLTGDIYANIL